MSHKGHPARKDPDIDKLYRTMKMSTDLVKSLEGRLSPDAFLYLKAGTLSLMMAYSELTGLVSPLDIILKENDDV